MAAHHFWTFCAPPNEARAVPVGKHAQKLIIAADIKGQMQHRSDRHLGFIHFLIACDCLPELHQEPLRLSFIC